MCIRTVYVCVNVIQNCLFLLYQTCNFAWKHTRHVSGCTVFVRGNSEMYFLCPRVQRWNFLCGCLRGCMRRTGKCCPLSSQRCTERDGGLCSMLTLMWWTCTRWDLITMVWDHKCCTLTTQRTLRLDRRCFRCVLFCYGGSTWIYIA